MPQIAKKYFHLTFLIGFFLGFAFYATAALAANPIALSIDYINDPTNSVNIVTGTSSGANPDSFWIRFYDVTADAYWDGTTWQPGSIIRQIQIDPANINGITGDWNFDSSTIIFTSGNQYIIEVSAIDNVDGSNSAIASTLFTFLIQDPVVDIIVVDPVDPTVSLGTTQQFIATAFDQFSNPIDAVVTWSSSDTSVGTIDPATGLFTSLAKGTTTVTATSGSVSGTSIVTVSTVCQTGADVNGDGMIGNQEILNYVRDWKNGLVSNLLVFKAIGFWKAGIGC